MCICTYAAPHVRNVGALVHVCVGARSSGPKYGSVPSRCHFFSEVGDLWISNRLEAISGWHLEAGDGMGMAHIIPPFR